MQDIVAYTSPQRDLPYTACEFVGNGEEATPYTKLLCHTTFPYLVNCCKSANFLTTPDEVEKRFRRENKWYLRGLGKAKQIEGGKQLSSIAKYSVLHSTRAVLICPLVSNPLTWKTYVFDDKHFYTVEDLLLQTANTPNNAQEIWSKSNKWTMPCPVIDNMICPKNADIMRYVHQDLEVQFREWYKTPIGEELPVNVILEYDPTVSGTDNPGIEIPTNARFQFLNLEQANWTWPNVDYTNVPTLSFSAFIDQCVKQPRLYTFFLICQARAVNTDKEVWSLRFRASGITRVMSYEVDQNVGMQMLMGVKGTSGQHNGATMAMQRALNMIEPQLPLPPVVSGTPELDALDDVYTPPMSDGVPSNQPSDEEGMDAEKRQAEPMEPEAKRMRT